MNKSFSFTSMHLQLRNLSRLNHRIALVTFFLTSKASYTNSTEVQVTYHWSDQPNEYTLNCTTWYFESERDRHTSLQFHTICFSIMLHLLFLPYAFLISALKWSQWNILSGKWIKWTGTGHLWMKWTKKLPHLWTRICWLTERKGNLSSENYF